MKRFIVNPSEAEFNFLNNKSYTVYKIAIKLINIDDRIPEHNIESGFYFMTEQYESEIIYYV